MERREVAMPGAPARPLVEELGTRERRARRAGSPCDHSSRYSMKSSRLASAHCMSSNTRTVGYVFGEPLEEEPPGGEEVVALVRGCSSASPSRLREPRLDPTPARSGSGMCSVERRVAASERAVGIVVVLGDAGAHAHHLGERPVGRPPRRRRGSGRGATRRRRRGRRCTSRTPTRAATCRSRRCPIDRDEVRRAAPRRRRGRAP